MAEEQIAWTAMPHRAPVLDSDGNRIGTAESLLGDEEEDVFHGIAVRLSHSGRMVEVPAAQVGLITREHVRLTVQPGDVDSLPDYQEERWYHIGWGGLFRKRPTWTRDE